MGTSRLNNTFQASPEPVEWQSKLVVGLYTIVAEVEPWVHERSTKVQPLPKAAQKSKVKLAKSQMTNAWIYSAGRKRGENDAQSQSHTEAESSAMCDS
jgi:hypothetical protein